LICRDVLEHLDIRLGRSTCAKVTRSGAATSRTLAGNEATETPGRLALRRLRPCGPGHVQLPAAIGAVSLDRRVPFDDLVTSGTFEEGNREPFPRPLRTGERNLGLGEAQASVLLIR
jgi:hypothetical protein